MKTINETFAEKVIIIDTQHAIEHVGTEVTRHQARAVEPMSWGMGWDGGGSTYSNTGPVPIGFGIFNGQKTEGALGSPINLLVDPRALRFRAYEANTTNDIVNIITGKFFKWVVGSGLKMQSEPDETILGLEGVQEDFEKFKTNIEAYFTQYASSTRSDYSGMDNLHLNAAKAFETSFLGGDCVVITRLNDKNELSCQVIDGQHLGNVLLDSVENKAIADRGNLLFQGIEVDKTGKHIAYYISKMALEPNSTILPQIGFERIACYGEESGCLVAWMVYGKKNRIDHHRGISMLSAILEKVTKIDRYTEATVATAEERSKLVWTVVHGKTSTGENPLVSGPRFQALGPNGFADNPYELGNIAATQIALTENRKVYNLPQDSELKAVSSQSEINYEPFWKAIFVQLCAAMDIPPEVALQQYNSNYSASRAAINAWGYLIDIYRKKFSDKFYKPFYDLWLYVHILKGKVNARGYIVAKMSGNNDIIEAYSAAKFTGKNMPHIDPLKEMNAMRVALGLGDQTPLATHEQVVEQLGYGDWDTNIKKSKAENDKLQGMGFQPIPLPPETPTDNATKI